MNVKKNKKKYFLIISIILVIILGIFVFNTLKKEPKHPVLEFLNYEIPYDGKAKIADYKNYTINMDTMLEIGYENYINDLIESYADWGDPVENAIVEDNSKIQISLSLYNGEKLLRTSDLVKLDLSEISYSKEITEELKKQLIGKTKGASFEFTFNGKNDASLLSNERNLDITYKGYLIDVLGDYKYPELTDEWVAENTYYNTIEDFKKSYMINCLYDMNYSEEIYYQTLRDYLRFLIEEDCEVIKNATVLSNISEDEIKKNIEILAKQFGLTAEDYIYNLYGITEDEFYENYKYNYSCAETLMVEIAMKENIDISEEAYNNYLLKLAKHAEFETVEEFLENYSIYYDERISKQDFVAETVLNKIIDNYIIIEESQYQSIVNDLLEYGNQLEQ